MISFRPHTIECYRLSGGKELQNGDYVQGGSFCTKRASCRYEPSGSSEVKFDDGIAKKCSYIVYMDLGVMKLKKGDLVRLYDSSGHLVADTQVLDFHEGQLDARLWL